MNHRNATLDEIPLLAELNHQLIRDEGHRNRMSVAELAERMRGWLESREYVAVLFDDERGVVGYALYKEQSAEIYLRQLFVVKSRRREGIGRRAVEILRDVWPTNKRLTVDVLCANSVAVAFWRALGYRDYSLTLEIAPE